LKKKRPQKPFNCRGCLNACSSGQDILLTAGAAWW
jgi:hypothetical protein